MNLYNRLSGDSLERIFSANGFTSFGHKTTVIFSRKREMIRRAKAINDARIKLVHYLEKESDEDNIRNLSKLIRDDFEVFFRDWQKAMKWFYSEEGLLKAQSRWKELFTKYSLD